MSSGDAKFRYQATEDGEICVDIAEALAETSGTDIEEIGPLADVIDTTAINRLFRSDTIPERAVVQFPVGQYLVTVRGTGEILIEGE